MALVYFALDGNYGGATGLVIADVSKWTDEDWLRIDEADDSSRPSIAQSISIVYEDN